MGRLIYSTLASLDGYIADRDGRFDWAVPGDDLHEAVNASLHGVGTFLLGRRTYEIMRAWDDVDLDEQPVVVAGFARIWRAADKVVYSRTLPRVTTARTRLEREFDPAAVRAMKADARQDLSIGGPELAAHALRASLVDECEIYLTPVVVGGGTHWLPPGLGFGLSLVEEHRFRGGVVFLRYSLNLGA